MWQDIEFGWRCWQHQRLRWLFLVIAWGIFSALAVIVVQLAWSLSDDRPKWANNTSTLYTVGYSLQQQLMTAKGIHLDTAQSTPGVTGYSKYALMTQKIKINGSEHKVSVLFYDSAFFDLLGADEQFAFVEHGGIFGTNYLRDRLNLTSANTTITLGKSQSSITHWFPKDFDSLSNKLIDLYLPLEFFSTLNPFFTGANATETQVMLNSLPLYFGLIAVDDQFNPDVATATMQSQVDELGNIHVNLNLDTNISLVEGLELFPQQRQELTRQLIILSIILIAFAFVLFSNYFSVMAAMALTRKQELSLKFALGAPNQVQLLHLFRENIPMLSLVFIVGLLSALSIQNFLLNSDIYQKYFGENIPFSWSLWAAVLISCLLAITLISLLPMLNLLVNSHFSRTKAGLSKRQQQLNYLQFGTQILLTLFAINFALASAYQEWLNQRTDTVDMTVQGHKITRTDNRAFSIPSAWLLGQNKQLTVSDTPLIKKHFPELKIQLLGDTESDTIFTDKMSVANNFFSLLNAKFIHSGVLSPGSVIINQALAKNLTSNTDLSQLINKQFTVENDPEQIFTIAGIVENLPHAGVNLSEVPMLYTSMQQLGALHAEIYIYTASSWPDNNLLAQLDLTNEWGKLEQLGDVEQQLIELNKSRRGLLLITLQIALFIFVMLTIGVLYQLKAMLMAEQRTLGLQLALGQHKSQLIIHKLLHKLSLCLISIVIFISASWLCTSSFKELIGLDIWQIPSILTSIVLVLFSVVFASTLTLKTSTKKNIQQLLTAAV